MKLRNVVIMFQTSFVLGIIAFLIWVIYVMVTYKLPPFKAFDFCKKELLKKSQDINETLTSNNDSGGSGTVLKGGVEWNQRG